MMIGTGIVACLGKFVDTCQRRTAFPGLPLNDLDWGFAVAFVALENFQGSTQSSELSRAMQRRFPKLSSVIEA